LAILTGKCTQVHYKHNHRNVT